MEKTIMEEFEEIREAAKKLNELVEQNNRKVEEFVINFGDLIVKL